MALFGGELGAKAAPEWERDYQPRFVAYLKATGKTPATASMRDFVAWVNKKLRAFKALPGNERLAKGLPMSKADHEAFTAYLEGREESVRPGLASESVPPSPRQMQGAIQREADHRGFPVSVEVNDDDELRFTIRDPNYPDAWSVWGVYESGELRGIEGYEELRGRTFFFEPKGKAGRDAAAKYIMDRAAERFKLTEAELGPPPVPLDGVPRSEVWESLGTLAGVEQNKNRINRSMVVYDAEGNVIEVLKNVPIYRGELARAFVDKKWSKPQKVTGISLAKGQVKVGKGSKVWLSPGEVCPERIFRQYPDCRIVPSARRGAQELADYDAANRPPRKKKPPKVKLSEALLPALKWQRRKINEGKADQHTWQEARGLPGTYHVESAGRGTKRYTARLFLDEGGQELLGAFGSIKAAKQAALDDHRERMEELPAIADGGTPDEPDEPTPQERKIAELEAQGQERKRRLDDKAAKVKQEYRELLLHEVRTLGDLYVREPTKELGYAAVKDAEEADPDLVEGKRKRQELANEYRKLTGLNLTASSDMPYLDYRELEAERSENNDLPTPAMFLSDVQGEVEAADDRADLVIREPYAGDRSAGVEIYNTKTSRQVGVQYYGPKSTQPGRVLLFLDEEGMRLRSRDHTATSPLDLGEEISNAMRWLDTAKQRQPWWANTSTPKPEPQPAPAQARKADEPKPAPKAKAVAKRQPRTVGAKRKKAPPRIQKARGRAREQFIDPVTGEPIPRKIPGAVPSGSYVARARPRKGEKLVSVPVKPEELGAPSYGIELTASELAERAARVAQDERERLATERKLARLKKQEIPGVRATFRTASKAAEEFAALNEELLAPFFGEVDNLDPIIEWADSQEVWVPRKGRGKGSSAEQGYYQRLNKTAKFRRIRDAAARGTGSGVIEALTWIFSQARTKRWSDVEWQRAEDLIEKLREGAEAQGIEAPGLPIVYPAASGVYSAAELLQHPEIQSQPLAASKVAAGVNEQRLAKVIEALDKAYKANRSCLTIETRDAVRRRLRYLRKLAATPTLIDDAQVCAYPRLQLTPETLAAIEAQGGQVEEFDRSCSFPVLLEDSQRLADACAQGYDPAWVAEEAPTWAGTSQEWKLRAVPTQLGLSSWRQSEQTPEEVIDDLERLEDEMFGAPVADEEIPF